MQDFNISTNIIRDEEANLNYIVTKNASENFDIIASNYKNNNKFQAIIGSYGTGKSSFLWAFEQNLKGKRNYFKSLVDSYPNIKDAVFIKLIGEYKSISNSLAKVLTIDDNNENIEERVLEKLSIIVKENWKKKAITILIIDEFGKFLEYAVKNNPDREVYFIQLLAEFFIMQNKLHYQYLAYIKTLLLMDKALTKNNSKNGKKLKVD
jgi:DNA helicase HerA-like ATPase